MSQFFGKQLIIFGLILIVFGVVFLLAGKVPYIGKLPGDILIKKGNFTFYFPLATSLIASVILSFVFLFFRK